MSEWERRGEKGDEGGLRDGLAYKGSARSNDPANKGSAGLANKGPDHLVGPVNKGCKEVCEP